MAKGANVNITTRNIVYGSAVFERNITIPVILVLIETLSTIIVKLTTFCRNGRLIHRKTTTCNVVVELATDNKEVHVLNVHTIAIVS